MSRPATLRIGEIRIEFDPAATDAAAVEKAIQAAFEQLAGRIQALLTGRDDMPGPIEIAEITVQENSAKALLDAHDYRRLADAVFAQIEARLGGVP